MNINKTSKRCIALLILSSSFLLFLVSNFRASVSGLRIEMGAPAQAQRGRVMGRVLLSVLGWVAGEVISGGTRAAVAEILDDDEYIGSHYVATLYSPQHGRDVSWHFFQYSSGAWHGYFPSSNTWQPVDPPSVAISRTANVYQRRSGELYWTNP